MRILNRFLSFLLVLFCVTVLTGTALAAGTGAEIAAGELYELGLFKGKGTNADGSPDYALDDIATRREAITMLVRLLGKDTEAQVGKWKTPFTDVISWSEPYVGYAYENGLTKGTTDTTFNGGGTITASQYITFVLRALGYEDGKDFDWKSSWELSDKLGITNGEYSGKRTGEFLREDIVLISRAALEAMVQGEGITLREKILASRENGNKFAFRVEPSPDGAGYRWDLSTRVVNNTSSPLTLLQIRILHCLDGSERNIVEESTFDQKDLARWGLGTEGTPLTVQPGKSFAWSDGHPVVDYFDCVVTEIRLADPNGEVVEYVYTYHLDHGGAGKAHPCYADKEGEPKEPVKPIKDGPSDVWKFGFIFENTVGSTITLRRVNIEERMGGEKGTITEQREYGAGFYVIPGEEGSLRVEPGEREVCFDSHGVSEDFDFIRYTYTFVDASGREVEYVYSMSLSHELPGKLYPSYKNDGGRDLQTLRYDADYCVEVYDGVYWVPARALGESDFTNAEIQAILTDTPEEKQAKIDTLYEALQLYQVGAFGISNDNIRIQEGSIAWEHHKPGYHAVRTNNGCCATDSNWLRYILDGDYDEIGYIAFSNRDGGGHIFNYILMDGWYYIIDLTHYTAEWIVTAVESGEMHDYYNSDPVLGNIHKVKDLRSYVSLVQDSFDNPPGLMFRYTAEDCLAVDAVYGDDVITITYENTVPLEVIFDDPSDRLEYAFVPAPRNYPDWSREESFDFSRIP